MAINKNKEILRIENIICWKILKIVTFRIFCVLLFKPASKK